MSSGLLSSVTAVELSYGRLSLDWLSYVELCYGGSVMASFVQLCLVGAVEFGCVES